MTDNAGGSSIIDVGMSWRKLPGPKRAFDLRLPVVLCDHNQSGKQLVYHQSV